MARWALSGSSSRKFRLDQVPRRWRRKSPSNKLAPAALPSGRAAGATLPDAGVSVRPDLDFATARKSLVRRWVTPITASAVLLALTTAVIWIVNARLQNEHLIFVYFVPTALIAIRYGSVSAMFMTIASTFAAAYFFYPPRLSFKVENPLDLLELILFSMLALLASQVVAGFANDRDVEKRRERMRAASWRTRWRSLASLWDRSGR